VLGAEREWGPLELDSGLVRSPNFVTPFGHASYSPLVNLAGTAPPTQDARGIVVVGAQREWGPLEYDPTLATKEVVAGAAGIDPAKIKTTVNANSVTAADRSSALFNHDGGTEANRVTYLIAKIRDSLNQRLVSTATIKGRPLTKLTGASISYNYSGTNWLSIDVYYLINPPPGTQGVNVVYNGTVNLADEITVITVPGAHQTAPNGADETAQDAGTTTNLPVAITTTVANSLILGAVAKTYQTHTAWTPGSGNVELTDGITGTTSAAGDLAYTDVYIVAATASAYTVSSTSDTNGRTVTTALEVKQAPSLVELAATINAVSSQSSVLAIARPLATAITAQSSIAASPTASIVVTSTVNAQSSIAAELTTNISFGAAINAQSSIVAPLTKLLELATTINAASSQSSSLTSGLPLAASANGGASISASLALDLLLASSVNAQSSTSSSSLDTIGQVALDAVISAQSGIAAGLITNISFEATANAQSSIVAPLTQRLPLASTINAVSDQSSSLTSPLSLASAVSTTSSISASLALGIPLASTINAQSSIVAAVGSAIPLIAAVNAQSGIVAPLTERLPLAGTVNAAASIAGANLSACPEPPALLFIINGQSNAGAQGDWSELSGYWQTAGGELQIYYPQGGLGTDYAALPSDGSQSVDGFGIELGMYEVLRTALPGRKVLFAKASLGGASITNWCSSLSCVGAEYDDVQELINLAISKALALPDVDDVKLAGIMWAQIEADTPVSGDATAYEARLERLITSHRSDAADSNLAVVFMAPHTHAESSGFPIIDAVVRDVETNGHHVALVETADLSEWVTSTAHFDTAGTLLFGQRYANEWLAVWEGDDCVEPGAGIQLGANIVAQSSDSATMTLRLPLAGSSTGVASIAANVMVAHTLVGSSAGVASTSANMAVVTGTLAASVSPQSSVAADLVVAKPLSATASGQSSTAAPLGIDRNLAATVNALSTFSATTAVGLALAGQVDGQGGIVGDLNPTAVALVADVEVQSSIAASLVLIDGLVASVQAQSSNAATLVNLVQLTGSSAGQGSTADSFTISLPLFGLSSGQAGAVATLEPTPVSVFSGTIRGVGRRGTVRSSGNIVSV